MISPGVIRIPISPMIGTSHVAHCLAKNQHQLQYEQWKKKKSVFFAPVPEAYDEKHTFSPIWKRLFFYSLMNSRGDKIWQQQKKFKSFPVTTTNWELHIHGGPNLYKLSGGFESKDHKQKANLGYIVRLTTVINWWLVAETNPRQRTIKQWTGIQIVWTN